MIPPVLILSSIFIVIAFIVNENNAKYLLSGYNTMSDQDKKKFDIKSYMVLFRNFHIFLGVSLFVITLILNYLVNPYWSGIFMGTYPILAYVYLIWKGNSFSKSNDKKQKTTTYITISLILALVVFILYNFKTTLENNKIILNNNQIEITGKYGIKINNQDLKSIELIEKLPEINSRVNGFALNAVKKGSFKTENGEKVTLLINSEITPIILITTKDNHKIYYSSKENSNEVIYNNLKREISKQYN